MISHSNFSIETILVQIEEIRVKSKAMSYRRKGWSIYDKKLLKIIGRKKFSNPIDFLYLIPKKIKTPFTNLELAKNLKKPLRLARKITYCLREMGVLKIVGKIGCALLFDYKDL